MLSGTSSCANALAICATHEPMTICISTACGGGPAGGCACGRSSNRSTDMLEPPYACCGFYESGPVLDALSKEIRRHPRERLGRIVAGAVLLERQLVVEDHAAAADDRRVGDARLPSEAAALELAVGLDDQIGRASCRG